MKRSLKKVLSEELTVKSLYLSYPFPQAFSESPWLPASLFIAYRLVLTASCVLLLIESIYKNPYYTWLLFYPNITIVVTTLYFLAGTTICIYCAVRDHVVTKKRQSREDRRLAAEHPENDFALIPQPDGDNITPTRHSNIDEYNLETSAFQPPDLESDGLSWMYKLHWACFNISANAIIAGTLIYFICDERKDDLDVGMFLSLSVFMLADTLISFVPVRLLHFVFSFMFTALYVLIIVIFLAVDNPADEHVFSLFSSFRTPAQVILVCVVVSAQPIFHAIYFGLHKLRWYLVALIYSRDEGL